MKVKVIKKSNFEIGEILNVLENFQNRDYYNVEDSFYLILKECCEIIEDDIYGEIITESNHTVKKINSEFHFTKEVYGNEVSLVLYIDYENKTYDFMQHAEEGVFPRKYNTNTEKNKLYFQLGLEVLDFVQKELYE